MPPVPADDPGGRRRPPGRYDEPSRTASRTLAVVLGVLFVGFLLALAWTLYQRFGTGQVPVQVRGFEVRDDGVAVEFDVTPPDGTTAWCLVRARDAAGAEIGREFVPVPASPDGDRVRVRHELDTTAEPVTGEVAGCRPSPPPAGEPTADQVSP